MYRISTNMTNDNMQFHLRKREFMLNQAQNRIAGQTRILNLRDDPLAAAHSSRYQSYLTRLERFSVNMEYAQSNLRYTEGYMRQSVEILQRVRELSVQGANGTYSAEDRTYMAQEVDQLLKELLSIANMRSAEGIPLFGGSRARTEPFRVLEGNVAGSGAAVIDSVEYIGNIESRAAEIADKSYIDIDFAGNRVFWAENQQIFSSFDARPYQVSQDTSIYIDDVEISLTAGDTSAAIIAKINDSGAAVRARLDPIRNSLVLETTTPHQLWIREEGTVLQDLGILNNLDVPPPYNIASSAEVYGGSLFDMVIRVRNAMFANDVQGIGGNTLQGIDNALDNVLSHVTVLGSRDERIQIAYARNEYDIPQITKHNSDLVDPDIAEEVVKLRSLEQTYQAALATTGRITPQTLLDFLR